MVKVTRSKKIYVDLKVDDGKWKKNFFKEVLKKHLTHTDGRCLITENK